MKNMFRSPENESRMISVIITVYTDHWIEECLRTVRGESVVLNSFNHLTQTNTELQSHLIKHFKDISFIYVYISHICINFIHSRPWIKSFWLPVFPPGIFLRISKIKQACSDVNIIVDLKRSWLSALFVFRWVSWSKKRPRRATWKEWRWNWEERTHALCLLTQTVSDVVFFNVLVLTQRLRLTSVLGNKNE